jgi:hypothetical protein
MAMIKGKIMKDFKYLESYPKDGKYLCREDGFEDAEEVEIINGKAFKDGKQFIIYGYEWLAIDQQERKVMRTSSVELLAEINTLEEITRKEAKDLEVVKTIEQLKSALKKLTHQYESDFDESVAMRPKWLGDALAI